MLGISTQNFTNRMGLETILMRTLWLSFAEGQKTNNSWLKIDMPWGIFKPTKLRSANKKTRTGCAIRSIGHRPVI